MDIKAKTPLIAVLVFVTLLNLFIAFYPDGRVDTDEGGEPRLKEECIAVAEFRYPPKVIGTVKVDDFYPNLFEQEVAYVSDGNPLSHSVVKITRKTSPIWYNAHSFKTEALYNAVYTVWIAPELFEAFSHPTEQTEMGGMNVVFYRENLTIFSEPVGGLKSR
jgi:hypothetical protein